MFLNQTVHKVDFKASNFLPDFYPTQSLLKFAMPLFAVPSIEDRLIE